MLFPTEFRQKGIPMRTLLLITVLATCVSVTASAQAEWLRSRRSSGCATANAARIPQPRPLLFGQPMRYRRPQRRKRPHRPPPRSPLPPARHPLLHPLRRLRQLFPPPQRRPQVHPPRHGRRGSVRRGHGLPTMPGMDVVGDASAAGSKAPGGLHVAASGRDADPGLGETGLRETGRLSRSARLTANRRRPPLAQRLQVRERFVVGQLVPGQLLVGGRHVTRLDSPVPSG